MKLTLRWTCRFERFLVSMIFQFLCFDSAVCSCSRQQKVKSLKPLNEMNQSELSCKNDRLLFLKASFCSRRWAITFNYSESGKREISQFEAARRKKWNCFPSSDSWRRHSVISIILRSHVSCVRVVRSRRYRAATQISYSINFRWKQKRLFRSSWEVSQ